MIRHHALARDERGATIIEFALIVPVMMMLIMGLSDMLFQSYAQAVLTGEVQKAGRDAGLEASTTDTVDARVVARMRPLLKNLTPSCATGAVTQPVWCAKRLSYDNFTEVGPEPFVDRDGDGVRDPGECYTDVNGNKQWDAEPGTTGQGGASAVTLYTMQITFPRMFPVARILGWSAAQTIRATTLLKNQPFATQTTTASTTICT